MKSNKVDITKLITPSAYAKKIGVTPAAVNKMMNEGRVDVVKIIGCRLICLK